MERGMKLKYLVHDVDRHGTPRVYLRRPGCSKVRLYEKEGTLAFIDEYQRAMTGNVDLQSIKKPPPAPHTLRWLIEKHYESAYFKTLDPETRKVRRRVLNALCESKVAEYYRGDLPYAEMERQHVIAIRDEKVETPEAARNLIKFLRRVFNWAIEAGLSEINPAQNIPNFKSNSTGWHTWTIAECHIFEAYYPLGSKERLAYDLLRYTGQRRSDVVKFGRQIERNGFLEFAEVKGGGRKLREIPILPELRKSIDATPSGHLAYLVTSFGKPFTANGFGNWFRKACDKAGLPQCSAHGLRKAGATIAAENGATAPQLMAIFGWTNIAEAERYTKTADRKRMTREHMHLIRENVPPSGVVQKVRQKRGVSD